MTAESTIDATMARWVVQSVGRLLALFSIAQGLNIVLSGPERWSASGFATALMLPGAPPSWGAALLLSGALALGGSLAARYTPTFLGHLLGAVWCVFFAMSFGHSALVNPLASTTGFFAYSAFAALFALIAVTYHRSRSVGRR